MDFKGKKVLVAGYGLIGTPLVKILIEEEGANVRVASLEGAERAHPASEFWNVDLLDFENCMKVCRGVDYVFNLLCIKGSVQAVQKYKYTFFTKNLLLEILLFDAAIKQSVPGFLFASSLAVYPPAEVFIEDDIWKGFPSENDWNAGWAKRMGEIQAQAAMDEFAGKITVSMVIPANTYGLFDDFDSEKAMVVPSLIKRAVYGENPFVVWGDGTQVRDLIFSEDVARGMIHIAKQEEKKPVNLGSGIGYRIRELVNVVVENIEKKPKIVFDASKPTGDKKRVLDISRARSLGWTPKVSLKEGIKRTTEWYKNR